MQKELFGKLNKITGFRGSDESYSPLFSSIGLEISDTEIGSLFFNYNRKSRAIFDKIADSGYPLNTEKSTLSRIVFGDEKASLAFFEKDSFIFETADEKTELFTEIPEGTTDLWTEESGEKLLILRGYSRNPDDRDPDEKVPFIIGIRAISGTISAKDRIMVAGENGKITLAIAFEGMKVSADSVKNTLEKAPSSAEKAGIVCNDWLVKYTENFSARITDEKTTDMLSCAIRGMLFNATGAQGKLSGHISPFPSRGGYPCLFLWDTYFQNLGYGMLDVELCKDFLRGIAANRRPDGKFPQFMCSTWDRPHDTQPALFGWAVMNIMGNDTEFGKEMLPALEANNEWWLNARMTRYGLVFCPSGLETGQDDSPRFDNGPTIACDMNSYLLNQLRSTARIAALTGDEKKAEKWNSEADRLASAIVRHLYCEEDNLFYDIMPDSGEFVKIVSNVSFLPLWAGAEKDDVKAKNMIERYLLSPEYMFGNVPFPSVAYNEEKYDPEGWWRGPTWMPTAWLLMETLEKYGYEDERNAAADRLFEVMLEDGKMSELFNSETGEGMGCTQQGWTCCIFTKLAAEKAEGNGK